MDWLRRILGREPPHLTNVPTVRRQKNYMGASGYAYEYFYEGLRESAGQREHVFTVSGDRKTWFALSVFVPGEAVQAWESAHGRTLAANERYAIAKMALFDACDQRESPEAMRAPVHVTAEQVEVLLGRLGVE